MPRNLPVLKSRQLIKILEKAGCSYYKEGKGDHQLYIRVAGQSRVVIYI